MAIPFSYSFRNLWTRKWTSILTAGGMALVTFVFAAVLMLAQGLQQTLIDTGSPDNVIVLRGGAETEVSSVIDRGSAALIEVQPEVAQDGRGEPIASKEALVLVTVPKKRTQHADQRGGAGSRIASHESKAPGEIDCRKKFSAGFTGGDRRKEHRGNRQRGISWPNFVVLPFLTGMSWEYSTQGRLLLIPRCGGMRISCCPRSEGRPILM